MDIIGQVVSGAFADILIRQKHGEKIELGELLVVEFDGGYSILQCYSLEYGSQIPGSSLELMAGIKLEKVNPDLDFMEPEMRNYILARVKGLANVYVKKDNGKKSARIPKDLPEFFTQIRRVTKEDLDFLQEDEKPVYLGNVRSGSRRLDVEVTLPGDEVFRHHILVPATTGRGKSNLVKVFSYKNLDKSYCGMLFIDPHDEYYGVKGAGLSKHPQAAKYLKYYTPKKTKPPGALSLVVNVADLRPWHLNVFSWTPAQIDALYTFFIDDGANWISNIVGTGGPTVNPATRGVLRRKFRNYLGLRFDPTTSQVSSTGIFDFSKGQNTISDIVSSLEDGKKVIIDTSSLGTNTELIISSIIMQKVFNDYKKFKSDGKLDAKPVITVLLEEAPRVIGKSVVESENIFGTIAREGRKFKVGLIAVTQLPSEIPREVLANLNTKIILGNEMGPERRAIIDSAAQDLSTDDRTIASLDVGEAIVSSHFTKFAVPIAIPFFDDMVKSATAPQKVKRKLPGT